ncbi:hypervirulence associated TUDOR domain-containing protein [Novosphingobium aquimarinum]|uniref:DUF2945 domain-containing protein n=1 Tax=Novosphingobium aquimarinum TaxID=2682494 RepID=UPI0012EB3C9C|nr:DUF2945 domain-containing protein [Novosphingobium aquimarinum]
MSNSFREGSEVQWNWGNGTATGKIAERFEREVSRTIKGERIRRKGDSDNPAYVICQDDGTKVLKRGSELKKA